MQFSLPDFTKTRILDIDALSQKGRPPNSKPGVQIACSVELPNTILTEFDGRMRAAIYEKSAAAEVDPQKGLDGVEPVTDLPNLTSFGRRLRSFAFEAEFTGFTLVVDYGTGGKSNLTLPDAKLGSFRFTPKEGGTVTLKFKVEANDVPEATFGKLATLKSRDAQIQLLPPEVDEAQQDLEHAERVFKGGDGVNKVTNGGTPDATDAFLAANQA